MTRVPVGTLSDGTEFSVNLTPKVNGVRQTLTTIGDVLSRLNAAAPRDGLNQPKFEAAIQDDYLVLRDLSHGTGPFSAESGGASMIGLTAVGLGIYGQSSKPNSNGNFAKSPFNEV